MDLGASLGLMGRQLSPQLPCTLQGIPYLVPTNVTNCFDAPMPSPTAQCISSRGRNCKAATPIASVPILQPLCWLLRAVSCKSRVEQPLAVHHGLFVKPCAMRGPQPPNTEHGSSLSRVS